MLEEKERFGTDDFKRMLRDQRSHLAMQMTPIYLEALKELSGAEYQEACHLLAGWDYDMHVKSAAALLFEIMWMELHRAMYQDELEGQYRLLAYNAIAANHIERTRTTGQSLWCDNVHTPDIRESFHDNIRTAFQQSVHTLTSMFGPDLSSWEWGKLHKVSLIHPLGSVPIVEKLFKVNRGPYAVGGSSHTVCPYSYPRGYSFVANHGASERHIFLTADWDRSLTVIPTGTSGIPSSPHYLDQTGLYVNNQFHRDHFSKKAVENNFLYKAVFE